MSLSSFSLETFSFLVGFITATIFWWLMGRMRPLWSEIRANWAKNREEAKARRSTGVEENHRRITLRRAQGMHLAAPLFALDEIVETYVNEYIRKKTDFPRAVTTASFKDLIKQSYPFHPTTISLLYENWGKLPTFQGTRSTLSLLSRILYELYSSRTEISLILPSDIDLANRSILTPMFQYLPSNNLDIFREEYNSILQQSKDLISNEDWKNNQKKIIETIFLCSIPIKTKGKGCSIHELN